jgi:transposase
VDSPSALLEENATLKVELELLRKKVREQAVEIHSLRARLELFCRRAYGRSAEEVSREQLEFAFRMLEREGLVEAAKEADSGETADGEETAAAPAARKRARRPRAEAVSPSVPRREVVHEPEETTCSCCGQEMARIGEERSEEIEIVPATVEVIEHVRPKYACPRCREGVRIAPAPEKLFDRGRYGLSFVAQVVLNKFGDHLPLYRQAEILRRMGIFVSETTLLSLVERTAELLRPLAESIRRSVLVSHVIGADETPIVVKGTPAGRRQGYLWTYAGDRGEVYFDYRPTRAGIAAREVLGAFDGYVQVDGYGGYDALFREGKAKHVGCWAHARRHVRDALGSEPEAAGKLLALIQRLYAVEAEGADLGAAEREVLRQEKARPLLQALWTVLDQARERALPKSPFGKAVGYLVGQKAALERYLEDGRIPIDNNHVERCLKPVALGRRNWLFAGSDRGAQWAAVFYTLLGTCKLQKVEPFAYLKDVLGRISTHPMSRVAELTPRGGKTVRATVALPRATA